LEEAEAALEQEENKVLRAQMEVGQVMNASLVLSTSLTYFEGQARDRAPFEREGRGVRGAEEELRAHDGLLAGVARRGGEGQARSH